MKKLMVLLIIAGLVPAACAELMPDGGFEGTGVWSGYGGYFSDTAGNWQYAVINTTADARTGSKALIMTAPGSAETWAYSPASSIVYGTFDLGASGWAAQWQAGIAASEGDVLQATAWVKEANGNADTGVALLKVELKNASGDTLHVIPVYGDVTAGWTQVLLPPFIVPGASQGQTVDSLSVVVGIEAGNNGAYHSVIFDDVSLTVPPGKALIPDPAVGATDVPVTAVLTWITGDPNTTNDEVYFGRTADYPDPSLLPLVASLPDGTETWNPPGDLAYGTAYSWRVDEIIDLAGPNNDYENEGDVWSFTTITKRPLITTQPSPAFANPNTSMTVVATDYLGGTANLSYQWYNSGGALSDVGAISGSATSTVTFTAPGESDADSYYCIVTDTVEALSTTSDSALMEVPRLYAQFSFEPDTISGPNVDNVISGDPEGEYDWDTTYGGPVTFGTGHIGAQAIEFEDLRDNPLGGDDDEWMWMDGSILDAVATNGSKQITIAMWAYLGEAVTRKQALFSALDPAWNANLGVYCPTADGGGTIRFQDQCTGDLVAAESVEWTISDANDLLGQWHHFAFSKNVDTGDMKIYMNGDLKATTNATLANVTTEASTGVYLGVATNYNETFTGSIDDFRLYNYALSDAEVLELYECSPIVYDLDFDCDVDLYDFAKLAEGWGGLYDIDDLVGLCGEWMENK